MKMKIVIIISIIFVLIVIGVNIGLKVKDNSNIPDNYIAVFNGGSGEVTYRTYIYKVDNGHANYGFDYINTTITTVSWDSSETKEKITGKGTVTWTDDVFPVAKNNNAYSYVTVKGKDYDIDTFAKMFLMN